MVDISFYHLEQLNIEVALSRLLEKTLKSGKKAAVLTDTEEEMESLNDKLWSYEENSWLPHGTLLEKNPGKQPVLLVNASRVISKTNILNGADFLFLTYGVTVDFIDSFERCFILFSGKNPLEINKAREQWRVYKKEVSFKLRYWQETINGGWEMKIDNL